MKAMKLILTYQSLNNDSTVGTQLKQRLVNNM